MAVKSKRKVHRCLGFEFTEEEWERMRQAERDSILFMNKFGKGRPARVNGEYYTPGQNPADGQWLPTRMAALYVGCSIYDLHDFHKEGLVERRLLSKQGSRNYYEFKVSSLDGLTEIIKNNRHKR